MSDIAQLGIEVKMIGAAQASDSLNRVADSGKRAESSVGGLTGALHGLAGAWAISQVAEAVYNLVNIGAKYEMLGSTLGVMANNAGKTTDEMMGYQKSLEDTGISALRARQSLQIMAAAQLDLSQASKLGRVAQDGATLAGINSSEAFQKLVQGISTGESRIIRHMGIMVNFKSGLEQQAKAMGMNITSMSEDEKMKLRLNIVLAEGAKRHGVYEAAMTTAGKQMLSMQRYTENLRVQIGETFNPATNAVVFALVAAFKEASDSMKVWQESGGQAEFGASLRAGVKDAIDAVKVLAQVIYDARVPLEIFIGMFAASKIGSWATATTASMRLAVNEATQGEVKLAKARLDRVRVDMAAAKQGMEDYATSLKAANGQFITNQAHQQGALAASNYKQSVKELTKSKQDLILAQQRAAGASGAFSAGLNALGGPIGVVITGLMLMTFLADAYRDKMADAIAASKRSLDDEILKANEEIKVLKEIIRLRKEGRTEEAQQNTDAFNVDKIPAMVRELDIQRTLKQELEAYKASKKDMMIADEAAAKKTGLTSIDLMDAQENIRLKEEAIAAQVAQTNTARATLLERSKLQKQNEEEALASRKKLGELGNDTVEKLLYYRRQMAMMEEKITDAQMKGYSYSKVELEQAKERAALAKEIAVWEAMYNEVDPKTKKRKMSKDTFDALKDQAEKTSEAIMASFSRVNDADVNKKILSAYATLVQENYEYGQGLEEIIKLKIQAANLDKENPDDEVEIKRLTNLELGEYITKMQRANDVDAIYAETTRKINENLKLRIINQRQADDQQFAADDTRSGGRLSANQKDIEKYQRALISLQDDFNSNRLTLETYNRELLKLKDSSGSAWAGAAAAVRGYTDQTSSLLADYFNGVAGNWHDMFSKMARDMEVAIIKAVIMKPIMDGLAASISNFSKGGNLGFWQAFMSGSGWGQPGGSANPSAGGGTFDAGGFSLPFLASGGNITGPTIVGEKGPEIFVPTGFGNIVANDKIGGGGPTITNTIQVIIQDGKSSTTSSSNQGNSIGRDLEAMMDAWATKNSRPGGLFNQIRG